MYCDFSLSMQAVKYQIRDIVVARVAQDRHFDQLFSLKQGFFFAWLGEIVDLVIMFYKLDYEQGRFI